MVNSVVVNYGRKRTDKLPDGAFDSLEVGGILTIEIDSNTDPADVWEVGFGELKERVDRWAREERPAQPPLQAIPAQASPVQGQISTGNVAQSDPQVQSTPPAPTQGGWVQQAIQQNTQAIQERMGTPEGASDRPPVLDTQRPVDEYNTPSTSVIKANEAVMYAGCRVFDSQVKPASNGNLFCSLRLGKRGPDGIPGQYATARSFEPGIVEAAKAIREGDFVDVYGFWKPWKNNPDKFDLELQKIERSQG